MTSKHAAPRRSKAGNHTSLGDIVGIALGLTVMVVGSMVIMTTPAGASMMLSVRGFLEFYVGVGALLGLTGTVMLGLIVGERTAVSIKHRILAQKVHRGFSLSAVLFLLIHIALKVDLGRMSILGVLIPFADGNAGLFANLGPLAGDLMLMIFITSVLRGRFARSTRPWMWRVLHATAYVSWPVSIAHGLLAGRVPAPWVSWAYIFALMGVGVVLAVRPFLRSMGMPSTDIPGMPAITAAARRAGSAAATPQLAAAAGGGSATVVTQMPASRAAYRSGGKQRPSLRSVSPADPLAVPDPDVQMTPTPGPQPIQRPGPQPGPQPGPRPARPPRPAAQAARNTGPNPVVRAVDPDPSTGPLAQVYRLPAAGDKTPSNGPRSRRGRAK